MSGTKDFALRFNADAVTLLELFTVPFSEGFRIVEKSMQLALKVIFPMRVVQSGLHFVF